MAGDVSRRRFLAGAAALGALGIGFHWPPQAASGEEGELNAWLVVAADGSVTVRIAEAEMGQGVTTALAMIVAEELECDWRGVRTEFASVNRNHRDGRPYGRMLTGGFCSVRGGRAGLHRAAAEARERLVAAAAARWGVPAASCRAEQGFVRHAGSGRQLGYGELAKAAARPPVREPPLKSPAEYRLLGRPLARLDTPAKVDGSALYGIDVRLPGMLYAAIAHCPVVGGTLERFDEAEALRRPGVAAIVEVAGALAAVADNWWRANEALAAVRVTWREGDNAKLDSGVLRDRFRAELASNGELACERGDFAAAMAVASRRLEVLYEMPFLAHAAMEPMNATAWVTEDRVDVGLGTQSPDRVAAAASRLTALNLDRIHVHQCYLGGTDAGVGDGFGRRFESDCAEQAIALSKRFARPVKVLWSREQDMRNDFYRPMSTVACNAGLDA